MLHVPVERPGMRSLGEFGFARSSSFLSEAPAAKASCPPSTSPKSFQQRRASRSARRAFQCNQNSSTGRSSVGRDDKASRVRISLLLYAGRRIPFR